MDTFKVRILSAEKPFYEGDCESLTVPTSDGERCILAHHFNMIAAIVPGEMHYRVPGGQAQIAAVSSGLVKVEDNEVLVLADSVERPEEIDEKRAKIAADAAREALLQKQSINEHKVAQAALARAISRLRVKEDFNLTVK